ncbi:Deoxyribonuclease, TatD family [Giardia muris]|uniref:Deoxyribonuclease, TatD family n=1 Tax=Giardia muris TaxID=5742 RepID=A0A4Z1T4E6_GIAMU|nr:Deoxyribonuclease, TatD family [Giardia muris]|eukprot:TNJ27301.1 Deoxyribonuclease, TatD family [Giardia muris]
MIDIAANLVDGMYSGVYHGSRCHLPDLETVVTRARRYGLSFVIVTCTNKRDYLASDFVLDHPTFLARTIGFHPTNAGELNATTKEWFLEQLSTLPRDTVAIGELGLDYDRLSFATKEVQLKAFKWQLEQALKYPQLPLFLHCRAAAEDFIPLLQDHREKLMGIGQSLKGVVHSFTGTMDELHQMLSLGLDIGLNGCSLKTKDNMLVAAAVPLSRLHLETDCPWCEIRPTHDSYAHIKPITRQHFKNTTKPSVYDEKQHSTFVKSRLEPAHINMVAEVLADILQDETLKPLSPSERLQRLKRVTAQNSATLFNLPVDPTAQVPNALLS